MKYRRTRQYSKGLVSASSRVRATTQLRGKLQTQMVYAHESPQAAERTYVRLGRWAIKQQGHVSVTTKECRYPPYLIISFDVDIDRTERDDQTYFLEPFPVNLPRHMA